MPPHHTAGGERVGAWSECDAKRELSVENLFCCCMCRGSWEGERGHGGAPGCVAAVWCGGWLTDGSATEWYGNGSERQACFSKKLHAQTSITSFCFFFTRSVALSFQPGRQDEMWALYVSAKARVSWRGNDIAVTASVRDDFLVSGRRGWTLASEFENTIAARRWDVFWQLKCVFAAVFLATKCFKQDVGIFVVFPDNKSGNFQ